MKRKLLFSKSAYRFLIVFYVLLFSLFKLGMAQTYPSHVGSIMGQTVVVPHSAFVIGNYAYVIGSGSLQIIDVTNSSTPLAVGTLDNGSGGAVLGDGRSIYVSGNYAYIACGGGNNPGAVKALEIVDVSNPAVPVHKGRLTDGSGGALLDNPEYVFVSGNYAYILNGSFSSNSLEIVDVSNPAAPTHKGSLLNGSGPGAFEPIGIAAIKPYLWSPSSVFVSGNYAYITSNSSGSALEVVDVSNPATPVHFGSLINGNGGNLTEYPNGGVDGTLSITTNVYISGTYAYLAGNNGLEVIDISAPSSPAKIGSLANGAGGASFNQPSSVFVDGNYAYVTNQAGNSLEIVDISNPAIPLHKGGLTTGAGGANLMQPTSVFVSGTKAYVIDNLSGVLEVVDVSNQSTPIHESSILHGTFSPPLWSPQSVFVTGNLAYVAGSGSNALEIVDVSNPTKPIHKGSLTDGAGGALLNLPASVFVAGNYAYLASYISNALEIVDVTNPSTPIHKGSLTDGTAGANLKSPTSVFVSGVYAYVVSNYSAIEIIDVSNPANPVHKNSLSFAGISPSSIFVSGAYAYIASASNIGSIEIVDVSNPLVPARKGSLSDGGGNAPFLANVKSIYVSGNYAYIAATGSDALEIVDVSSPANPVHKGSLNLGNGSYPFSIFVTGTNAYVANSGSNSLDLVDVTNPSTPILKGSLTDGSNGALLNNPYSVFVSGGYAYVASQNSNALEIDAISAPLPTAPVAAASTSVTSTSFIANWGAVTGATGYQVDVSTASNFSNFVSGYQSATTSGTSLAITGLAPSTVYYFQVRAVSGGGASGNSNAITATTTSAPPVPSPYTLLDKLDQTQTTGASGVAFDQNSNVYVSSGTSVKVFNQTGAYLRSIGSAGTGPGQFQGPQQLAVDNAGNVYVADGSNGNVQVFDNTGVYLRTIGAGTILSANELTLAPNGNLYISDGGNQNILIYKTDGTFVSSFTLTGTGSATFSPWGIGVDGSGNVYVADAGNKAIQVFNSSNGFVKSIGSAGTGNGHFNSPLDVKVDSNGKIYVANNATGGTVQIFDNTGAYLSTLDGSIGGQKFKDPFSVAIKSDGSVIGVADHGNNLVQVFGVLNNASQVITFNISVAHVGDGPVTLNAASTSGLPITYSSSNPAVATVSGNVVTIVAAGSTIITAIQAGNASYQSASVQQTLSVYPAGTGVGQLWGMTNLGGSAGMGTIFKYDLAAATYTKVVDFTGPNGSYPSGNLLVASDGNLYGAATNGGSKNLGVLFQYDVKNSVFNKLLDFDSAVNGKNPWATLVQAPNGKLYGSTTGGGSAGYGVLFEYDISTSTLIKKIDYTADVQGPTEKLTSAPNGKLYGMIGFGGVNGFGTIFEYNAQTNTIAKRFDFDDTNSGSGGQGYLTLASDGKLYGATQSGGANGVGVAFAFDPSSFAFSKIYDFSLGTSGGSPFGSFALGYNNRLYGFLSTGGGTGYFGTLSEYDPVSVALAVDFKFVNANTTTGYNPRGTPFQAPDGKLYALAKRGGANNLGTIFKYDYINSALTKLYDFGGADGASPNVGNGLVFVKQGQTINFGALATVGYGSTQFALSATASSGLSVTFSSSDTTIAKINGTTVTVLSAGAVTITASQSGDATYSSATPVPRTLTITKAPQTISFSAIANKTMGDAAFNISATASSGLTVELSTPSPGITVTGNTVTIVASGNTTIWARQPGNVNYDSATRVSQTFCVNPAKPTITMSGGNSASLTLTSSSASGNQWFLNGTSVSDAVNQVLSVTEAGSYTVQVTIGNCQSALSDAQVIIVTGDIKINSLDQRIILYPNPGKSYVNISLENLVMNQPATIQIFDILGRSIGELTSQGGTIISLDINNYGQGTYLIRATQSGNLYHARFVKQ